MLSCLYSASVFCLFSFLFVIEHMMPLCMVISWVYSVAMMIQHIVAEKEQRLKEVRTCCSYVVASLRLRTRALAVLTAQLIRSSMAVSKIWLSFFALSHLPTHVNISINHFLPLIAEAGVDSCVLLWLQVMKMMGLNNAVHWVAWFITGFVQLSISVTALTAILKYGRVLLHSDPFIIWLFLTIYAVATIMFW